MTTQTPAWPQPVAPSWQQTLSNALIITRREVRDSFRDWRIITPIVVLTFVFPFLAQFLAARLFDFVTDYDAQIIGDRAIPFLLMVVGFFPISISLVIALETFVGEKERRSLEPLLSSPLTNTELYIGKTLAAMIPPLVASLAGMLVYLGSLLFGELVWRPAPALVLQIMLLTVVQALVMVTGAVVVSSQATSTRAANLLASFIIIPMTLMVQAESAIMFVAPDAESPNGILALWGIIAAMLIVTVLFLRVGNAIFNREELLGRVIDEMNLRASLGRIIRYILAVDINGSRARHPLDWYRRGVFPAVRRLGAAVWISIGVFIAALVGGYLIGQDPNWQLTFPAEATLNSAAPTFEGLLDVQVQQTAVGLIVWQNARVLLLALVVSIFTFGAGALILNPVVFVVIGYLFSQIVRAGWDTSFIFAALLPHGVVEIPIIILATAAALKLGAVVTKPPQHTTVGQAWMWALGDAIKIGIGVVLPGLILGALLESFLTPQVVLAVLRGG
jgi:uncharacterized membrane protein SpoIIM required for sporulation/ABC-type transport system involved in multi-copper enzyme maturation permease subunit